MVEDRGDGIRRWPGRREGRIPDRRTGQPRRDDEPGRVDRRRDLAQGRVQTPVVVLVAPRCRQRLGFTHIGELLGVEQLIAPPRVEALGVAVLPRAARRDVQHLHPRDLTVNLNPDGSVTLRWKARDASVSSGAIFDVSRRVGISGPYVGVGASVPAGRSAFAFTDSTLAFGTDVCSYIFTPRRGTRLGTPSPSVNVQLGTAGGPPGSVSIAGVNMPLMKMAA